MLIDIRSSTKSCSARGARHKHTAARRWTTRPSAATQMAATTTRTGRSWGVAGVVLLGVMSRVYSKRFGREIDVQSVGSVSGNGVGVKNGEYRPVGGGLADLELSH